jgi:hypothetical protein
MSGDPNRYTPGTTPGNAQGQADQQAWNARQADQLKQRTFYNEQAKQQAA